MIAGEAIAAAEMVGEAAAVERLVCLGHSQSFGPDPEPAVVAMV